MLGAASGLLGAACPIFGGAARGFLLNARAPVELGEVELSSTFGGCRGRVQGVNSTIFGNLVQVQGRT